MKISIKKLNEQVIMVIVLFLITLAPTYGTIIDGNVQFSYFQSADNNSPGISPFIDKFFLATTGSSSPSDFTGKTLVPVNIMYSIDLVSGQGTITQITADNSTLMSIVGQAGAFSLISSSSGPFPYLVFVDNISLLSIARLENPVGTSLQLGSPEAYIPPFYIDLGFFENPSINSDVNAAGYWWYVSPDGSPVQYYHLETPEPDTIYLMSLGLIGMVFVKRRKIY